MMTESTQTIALTPTVQATWVHPNADERGYYHWTVSPEMMHRIASSGRGALSDRERVGFVYNLGSLLQAGALHGDDYLTALSSFGGDATPEVVGAALDAIRGVRMAFVLPETRNGYAAYLRRSFQPALDRVGQQPRPDDSPAVEELRPRLMVLLGTDGQDEALAKRGQEMTKAYLADPASVHPSLVNAALRLAATRADRTLYDEYRRRFETAQTPVVRGRFLAALGGFRDSALVTETLRYALEGPLKPQEMLGIFRNADNPEMVDRLWPWYRDNYDRIMAKIPAAYRFYSIYLATGCTQQRIDAVKAFFTQPEHSPPGMQQELGNLVAQMGTCVTLRDREGARVTAMLNGQASATR
jgi:alanyl aminopeptidase